MDAFEKLIMTMREEGSRAVDIPSFGLAEMTGEKTLTFNGLDFDEDDVLFADYLLEENRAVKKVNFTIGDNTPSEHEGYHVHPWTDKSKYVSALSSGDTVFGFMVTDDDDDEKFLVVCRVGGV